MKDGKFSEDLFFTSETGKELYESYAKQMPIIDFHCHLSPAEIFENKAVTDIGELWLAYDHYKWRIMRTFGIDEELITGKASYFEKFCAFAKVVPEMIGNPMYNWCALELKRYFGIDEPLSSQNAELIFKNTKQMIAEKNMTPRYFIEKSGVDFICTTDDPIDDLKYHLDLKNDTSFKTKVVPAFRPDKALYIEKEDFKKYINSLAEVAETEINNFDSLLKAFEVRLKFFKSVGSTISDNSVEVFDWACCTKEEIDEILKKSLAGDTLTKHEIDCYRSAFLLNMGKLYKKYGFVMQLHVGAYRNPNKKMFEEVGPDTGFDSSDDGIALRTLGSLFSKLNYSNELPKIIIYPINHNQFQEVAVLAAAFCGGGIRGKVQLGAPWWFSDQSYGITKYFENISNVYPVSLSVGMLTDSRSYLSYPRHEVYRRLLCNFFGSLIESGVYYSNECDVKQTIQNICYYNAKNFFEI